jgi:hypothetical protein
MSMPITAIWVLAVLGMGVLLMMQPLASVARWRGKSTAGPSHYEKSAAFPARPESGLRNQTL